MTSYRFDTPNPVALFVENSSGSVQVSTVEAAEALVEITGSEAHDVTVTQEGDRIHVIAPRHRAGFLSGGRELHMAISVPTGSDLSTKTGSAEVTAGGRYGATKLKSGSGDVYVEQVADGAVIKTGSGGIEVGEAAELRIRSGSGDVRIDRARGASSISTGSGDVAIGTNEGAATIKTGSGDLRVSESQSDVSLSTGSGDLAIESAKRGRITVNGASGDVQVGVPFGTPVWTDISTISGQISSGVASTGEPEAGADYVELRAKTASGDVTLIQA